MSPLRFSRRQIVGGLSSRVGGVQQSSRLLNELAVRKTLDEMTEPDQAGQYGHSPGVAKAEPRRVETLVTGRGLGDLLKGHHIGGWPSICGFGVTQPPVGGFTNSPESIPVLGTRRDARCRSRAYRR